MRAIIGIGVPGSGKTATLKALATKEGLAYVNADDIRAEITGDPADHTKEKLVWQRMHQRIGDALRSRGVVIDATHSKRKDRRNMTRFVREQGAGEIIGLWFDTPLATSLGRNKQRERIVPPEALQRMHRRLILNPPSREEGFDEIIRLS